MDEKQMTKGREAYRMMDEACNQLVQSGNWQRVGSSDIKLFLDMYVQALLLKMAQTTGEISGDMLTYIARVPARDILKIGQAAPSRAASSASRAAVTPTRMCRRVRGVLRRYHHTMHRRNKADSASSMRWTVPNSG